MERPASSKPNPLCCLVYHRPNVYHVLLRCTLCIYCCADLERAKLSHSSSFCPAPSHLYVRSFRQKAERRKFLTRFNSSIFFPPTRLESVSEKDVPDFFATSWSSSPKSLPICFLKSCKITFLVIKRPNLIYFSISFRFFLHDKTSYKSSVPTKHTVVYHNNSYFTFIFCKLHWTYFNIHM